MHELLLDSSIWGECEIYENINLTIIQLQPTPKPARVFQYTKYIVEEYHSDASNHNPDGIEKDHLIVGHFLKSVVLIFNPLITTILLSMLMKEMRVMKESLLI